MMMHARSGFGLLDVIVGLLIASLLSIVLYRVFSQTMRIAHTADGLIEDYSDALLMSAQLERDITSVVVLKAHEKFAEQKNKPAEQSAAQAPGDKAPAAGEKASAIKLTDDEKKDNEQKEEEQLAFVGVIKDNKLSSLSFVCTNGLPLVDGAASRLVRVRYFLEPDVQDPSLSRLMREERVYQGEQSKNVSERPSMSHAYTIMPRIESITMKFYGTMYAPPGSGKSSSSPAELVTLFSWGNEEQRKKLKRLVPEYVEIQGTYQSAATHKSLPFSVHIEIPAGVAAGFEGREQEKQEAQKNAQKPKGAA